MADQALAVQITAVDRFSAALTKFRDDLERSGVPVEKLAKAAKKLEPGAGLGAMGKAFGEISTRARGAADELARVVPPLAAISGAASLAGMAKLVGSFGDWGTRLGNQAARVGVTSDALQTFQNAARLAGVSSQAATGGLQALTDTLRDAAGGHNPQVLGWFRALGVSMTDASGRARSASELMPQLADKIATLKNPSDQARVAVALFGGAGEEMLPFLRRGAAGMRDLADTAKRYGVTNEAGVHAADAFRESQVRVQLAVEGLTNSVAERLAPALVPLLNRLADWTAQHAPAIAAALGRIADGFAAWVNGGGFDQTIAKLEGVASTVNTVVQALGGWDRVAEAAFGVMAVSRLDGFAKGILGIAGGFGKAEGAASGLLGKMALLNAALLMWKASQPQTADDQRQARLDQDKALGGPGVRGWLGDRLFADPREQIGPLEAMIYRDMNRGGPGDHGSYPTDEHHRPVRGQGGAPISTPEKIAREKQAIDFFAGQGWTRPQAIGITANLVKESGLREDAVGDQGTAYGLAQLHENRRAALERAGFKVVGASFAEQLRGIQYELTQGAEQAAGRAIRMAGTAPVAAAATSRIYERPADADGEAADRARIAQAIELRDLAPSPSVPVPSAPPVAVPAPVAAQGAPGPSGSVNVRIVHSGAPAGTRMTAAADGDVSLSTQGLVEQAFPLIGGP